jgi:hypothetical protein
MKDAHPTSLFARPPATLPVPPSRLACTRKSLINKIAFISSFIVLGAAVVQACCMVPATYQGSVGQDAQEAVLIHDGGREELVLRVNYRISGTSMPDTFAWVVTVPNEPDAYAVADAKLFEEMFELSERLLVPKTRGRGAKSLDSDAVPQGIELGKRVQVGPYDIQPVRGVGPKALAGLNAWLGKNGFPPEDPAHMTYFVQHKFTFLCVRISPAGQEKTVSGNGLLPPLHLSFKSAAPYYPLRFSSRQGVFDVNLHVLTRSQLDYDKNASTLQRLNWSSQAFKRNVTLTTKEMPETLGKVLAKSVWKGKVGIWRYNNLRCSGVNRGNSISTWKQDIFFADEAVDGRDKTEPTKRDRN